MTTVPDPNGNPDIERPIDLTDTPEREQPDRVPAPEPGDDTVPGEPSGRPAPDITPMS
ncbi:hypothetical protein [Catenuloplanes atrovinosus]|uniref:Uncharacterized protein n=1 Tax=Catenuloplanes atrovinosus TaxID=137266 RepID=A0AAE3YS42_9ACTN|nr:hypothetical protein [Catenuloplanes atrovinosus]MDR7277344.1 hypothetical protein [Catenuloplanes atrovinosus]